MESVATKGGTRTLRGQHNKVKLKLTILSVLVCQETQLQAASILDCWWAHHHYEGGTIGRCKELASFLRPKPKLWLALAAPAPTCHIQYQLFAIGLNITLLPVNTVLAIQNKHNLPNNGGNGKKTFRSRTDQGGRQGTEIDIESVAVHDIVLYLISCSPPRPAKLTPSWSTYN